MLLRWRGAAAVLLLAGVVSALIPDNIYQCYKDENYELFNRANRQGMSIDQLIGLIEKLEHSSQAQNMSPQRITASLMRRFRYDGIIDQNVNSEMSSYLEPYTVIQPENSKYQMMTRLVQLANANFPDEAFTLEERCTMHWMLSHSVNETEREDENDYCARSFRRRRRRRRAARRYNSRSSSSGSSAKTAGGFVSGNVVEEDASSCPLELGVIYSPYGTVAAGSLIAGLAAGLSEQDVSVEDTVGADTLTMQSLSDQQRRLQINNIWATTIAGDIAQTALHYEGGGQNNNAPQVIGPTGYWNCTYCPHEYNMPDSDAISALTNAEIYGGIDGYLLGSQIYRWSKQTGFRLSSLLRMYYSPDGVSYDRQFRACDRLTNFLNGDLVNQDTLKTQAVNFGFAYYSADLGRMPMLNQDSLDEAMDTLMTNVIEQLNDFAGKSMTDDGPGCKNVPAQGATPDEPTCSTKADVVAVFDPSVSGIGAQAQKIFLSELALALDVGWNKSYMHLVSGEDGAVLLDKWNYTNKARLACDIQRVDVPDGQYDLVATLYRLMTYYADMLDQEANDGASRSNTQVLLLMRFGSGFSNSDEDITTMLNNLCEVFPDINIMTVSDSQGAFSNIQQAMDRRQFLADNMFASESSQRATRETLVPEVITNMCNAPSRFVYPACHTDDPMFTNVNEGNHEYTYYVEPNKVTYLRVGPQQFFSSNDLKIQFESVYGPLQVCLSRTDPQAPVDADDAQCVSTESSQSSQVEFELGTPCSEDQMNDDCPPLYFSIQQNPEKTSAVSVCTDDECPFPDSIQFTITHENMRCNSASGATLSLLLLGAAAALRRLFG
ncbi:N-acetylmuramoyl-L-alanine amidase [Amphibalanus amphitrite]|uniref:N-acetylmuramoyl-L-alanine amidase n=1 Tax=Amphibalanus amphitrite TaxID=1232801 RepID=A0A6A4VXY2_AMPAM|nr:N-acetylmuramoyl-L-alanine amidase [Amphibalanus amphitrite]